MTTDWTIDQIVGRSVHLPREQPPRLLIAVHTEEEFAWGAGFFAAERTVSHVAGLQRAHELANALGFSPTYFCTSPVLESREATAFLRGALREKTAYIGTHLHPWVTAPMIDEVPARESYPGNLPRSLEAAKLRRLTDEIEDALAVRPNAYLAGRYGFGPNTTGILQELGYRTDFSVSPGWCYTRDGGPDLRNMPTGAFWNRSAPGLLHVTHTGGYAGFLSVKGKRLVRTDAVPMANTLRLPSIAAWLGAQRAVRLTIEGTRLGDQQRFARHLVAHGERMFVLSFHSPSMAVGKTPYARSQADLEAQLERYAEFLRFFTEELQGTSIGPDEMYRLAQDADQLQAMDDATAASRPAAASGAPRAPAD